MTWYVSGPMSGYDDNNFPAFSHATKVLRSRGFEIISPHEIEIGGHALMPVRWDEYLRADLKQLVDCHGIVLLRGWSKSRGARLELATALGLGFTVAFFDELTNTLHSMD